jgi:hypothetical protein
LSTARILADAFNFRDLGGLPTADGRAVRAGRVFRSNCLIDLGPADLEALRSRLRIATVIDLRGPAEAEREGPTAVDALAVRLERLPLIDEKVTAPGDMTDLLSRYESYLTGAGSSIVRALEIIADDANHPVVFHCTTGKDRTGVVAAVLLACLGVAPEVIAADYGVSARDPSALHAFVMRRKGFELLTDERHPLLEADPKTMLRFLETLETRHGGACAWVTSAGLAPEQLDRLHAVLLEPPG